MKKEETILQASASSQDCSLVPIMAIMSNVHVMDILSLHTETPSEGMKTCTLLKNMCYAEAGKVESLSMFQHTA